MIRARGAPLRFFLWGGGGEDISKSILGGREHKTLFLTNSTISEILCPPDPRPPPPPCSAAPDDHFVSLANCTCESQPEDDHLSKMFSFTNFLDKALLILCNFNNFGKDESTCIIWNFFLYFLYFKPKPTYHGTNAGRRFVQKCALTRTNPHTASFRQLFCDFQFLTPTTEQVPHGETQPFKTFLRH